MGVLSSKQLAAIRTDYALSELRKAVAGDDPMAFFNHWFAQALEAEVEEVNAFTLATTDAQGWPHARIVLLKGIEEDGFVFFTNYQSAKGEEIAANNKVSLLFFWAPLQRQVRIEGYAKKVSAAYSDEYFSSRPRGSQIGAWASEQSAIVANRKVLEERENALALQFEGKPIDRPNHWGGYLVTPVRIEFWQGRNNRLHDRICFSKQINNWKKERLAP